MFLSLITEVDFAYDFLAAFSHLWIVLRVNVKILGHLNLYLYSHSVFGDYRDTKENLFKANDVIQDE